MNNFMRRYKLPSQGKLKWIGGNIGLSSPTCEEVLDSSGNVHYLGLSELLPVLDDFEGYRFDKPIKKWLIDCCFSAYEYKFLTSDETNLFEAYVRERLGEIVPFDAARTLLTSS